MGSQNLGSVGPRPLADSLEACLFYLRVIMPNFIVVSQTIRA